MLRCLMNRRPNPLIRAAAAKITRHGRVDVLVARILVAFQQRDGLHDLARLAVPALRYPNLKPSLLHRMHRSDALNRSDLGPGDLLHRSAARANGRAVAVYSTGSAQCHTAAELRPRDPAESAWFQNHRQA